MAAAFEAKQVKGPIHLCSDEQAEPLIEIFKDIRPEDWIFCTWRNHFHALLKGVPEEELFAAICAGRSMYFSSKEYRVVSSAIVGGIFPLALGVGMGIKRAGGSERVWVFCGDMAARGGLFHEFAQYATGHGLNIRVATEDNGYSTNANTEETWGGPQFQYTTIRYSYRRNRPHTGTGKFVTF